MEESKMKNTKKRNKKHSTRNNIPYTPGRNAFGEKAETEFIILNRETALQQYMDAISELERSNVKKEYTFDCSCFIGHEDEYAEVMAKVQVFRMFLAAMR